MSDDAPTLLRIEGTRLRRLVAGLFAHAGLSEVAAARVAEALVEADLQGVGSHGVLQADGYLDRMDAGSISCREAAEVVLDGGAVVVLDAGDMLGQLSAEQAMALAVERSERHGIAAVAVRRACHFGTAGRYAAMAAESGCIGIVMANTRAVMPAPGGAEPMVGTNPLAIGIPTATDPPIVLDMATSAGSVGRVRAAAARGEALPPGWAVDADGNATTDPAEALKGMMLPAAGPKGFGLSLAIDLICGLLSSGGWGDQIVGNREELDRPPNSAHVFIAIDPARFRDLDGFLDEANRAAARVRGSRRAPGVDRIYVPGERKWQRMRDSGDVVQIPAATWDRLVCMARMRGFDVDPH